MNVNLAVLLAAILADLALAAACCMGAPGAFLVAGALVLFALLLVSVFLAVKQQRLLDFLRQESRRKKAQDMVNWDSEETEELKLIRQRMELSVLQEQINPHFLYNTLDSIRSRALMDGQKEIAKMTEILSRFFRYCISSTDQLVKVREELHHIQDYYYIQKYRFEDRLEMEVWVEDEDIYDFYLPRMTLQPLVENAMVHGLERMAGKGMLTLRLFRTDDRLLILISDNGIGMNRDQLASLNGRMKNQQFNAGRTKGRHSGIALNNVNARLKLTFGDEYGIHYRSMEGAGTDAWVTLPVVDVFSRVKYEEKTAL